MTIKQTGRAEFDAERDVIRAAAVQARQGLERPAWHDRLGQLLDACAGIPLTDHEERLLRYLSAGAESTRAALDLFEKLRRGAYPDVNDDDQEPIQGVLVPPAGVVPGSPGPYRPDPAEPA